MDVRNALEIFAESSTKRRTVLGALLTLAGLAAWPAEAQMKTEEEISHTAESIHQDAFFKASPKRVYEALTTAKEFDGVVKLGAAMKSKSLGDKPTQITNEEGTPFVLFGGYITGRQIELLPNQRIVQVWRVGSWPSGIYSIARFELSEHEAGTKISFDHTGFPKGLGEHLAIGWKSNYWEPLEKYLS